MVRQLSGSQLATLDNSHNSCWGVSFLLKHTGTLDRDLPFLNAVFLPKLHLWTERITIYGACDTKFTGLAMTTTIQKQLPNWESWMTLWVFNCSIVRGTSCRSSRKALYALKLHQICVLLGPWFIDPRVKGRKCGHHYSLPLLVAQ